LGIVLLPGEEAAVAEDFFAEIVFEAIAEEEAAVGGVADSEPGDHLFVQAASGQVFAGARAFGTAKALLEESDSSLMDVEKLAAEPGFFGLTGSGVAGFRQRNAKLLRNQPDGFGESDVFDLLDEAEDVARDATTEAVIELARGVNGKRCSFLAVEGAEPGVVLRSGLLQLDVVADDADDVGLLFDRVREIAWVRHL